MQNELDQDEADTEVGADLVLKNNPNAIVKATDTNEDGTISEDEKKQARTKTGRKWNALAKESDRQDVRETRRQTRNRLNSKENREQADWNRENKEREQEKKSLVDLTVNTMGVSKDMATTIVDAGYKNFKDVYTTYEKLDDTKKLVMRSTVNQKASKVAGDLNTYASLDTPEKKEAFAQEKTKELQSDKMKLLEQIAEFKGDGYEEQAQKLKKQVDAMPTEWNEKAMALQLSTLHVQMKELDRHDDGKLTRAQVQTQTRSDRTDLSKKRKELNTIAKDYFKPPKDIHEEGYGDEAEFKKDEQRAIVRDAEQYLGSMTEQQAFEKAMQKARGKGKKKNKPEPKTAKQPKSKDTKKKFVRNIRNKKTGEVVGYYSDGSVGAKQ